MPNAGINVNMAKVGDLVGVVARRVRLRVLKHLSFDCTGLFNDRAQTTCSALAKNLICSGKPILYGSGARTLSRRQILGRFRTDSFLAVGREKLPHLRELLIKPRLNSIILVALTVPTGSEVIAPLG